ncbi:MAG: hypothetical protein MZU95_05025 [Desulfomicrobium escambiense]|nr:hypothetical protein [Desulfomicrobium escambiense]
MDELEEGASTPSRSDGSSSVGITASSGTVGPPEHLCREQRCGAIPPRPSQVRSIIMSMVSSPGSLHNTLGPGAVMRDRIAGIPVVSGDIGTGDHRASCTPCLRPCGRAGAPSFTAIGVFTAGRTETSGSPAERPLARSSRTSAGTSTGREVAGRAGGARSLSISRSVIRTGIGQGVQIRIRLRGLKMTGFDVAERMPGAMRPDAVTGDADACERIFPSLMS